MALEEAWSVLKEDEDDFVTTGDLEVDHVGMADNVGHDNMAHILGVHPNSVKLALDRISADEPDEGEDFEEQTLSFLDHVQDGEGDVSCFDCGWGGKGHELNRERTGVHSEGKCPDCEMEFQGESGEG